MLLLFAAAGGEPAAGLWGDAEGAGRICVEAGRFFVSARGRNGFWSSYCWPNVPPGLRDVAAEGSVLDDARRFCDCVGVIWRPPLCNWRYMNCCWTDGNVVEPV